MATLTIRNLDEDVKAQLRLSAAQHGCSMEAEARAILREALVGRSAPDLGVRIHELLRGLGVDELELPSRTETTRVIEFDE